MGWNWEADELLCRIIRCSSSAAEMRLDADCRLFTEAQRRSSGSAEEGEGAAPGSAPALSNAPPGT